MTSTQTVVYKWCMKRIDAYIHEAQFFFITSLAGTLSEHLRRALDDYITKLKANNVSASKSKKGGNQDG